MNLCCSEPPSIRARRLTWSRKSCNSMHRSCLPQGVRGRAREEPYAYRHQGWPVRALGHGRASQLIRQKVPELVVAGAKVVRDEWYGDSLGNVVMHDPEGNEFRVALRRA